MLSNMIDAIPVGSGKICYKKLSQRITAAGFLSKVVLNDSATTGIYKNVGYREIFKVFPGVKESYSAVDG